MSFYYTWYEADVIYRKTSWLYYTGNEQRYMIKLGNK